MNEYLYRKLKIQTGKILFICFILFVLFTLMSGCASSSIMHKEYYPPAKGFTVKVIDKETKEVVDIKGAIKSETKTERTGANEFSPGKNFEFSVQGISL